MTFTMPPNYAREWGRTLDSTEWRPAKEQAEDAPTKAREAAKRRLMKPKNSLSQSYLAIVTSQAFSPKSVKESPSKDCFYHLAVCVRWSLATFNASLEDQYHGVM